MAMNNSLAEVHPELVSEWSEKNLPLTPDDITFGSNKKVWWRGACGHEWQTSVKARSNGEKCPICSGARVIAGINDLATLEPLLVKQWSKKNKIKPTEVSIGSHKKVIWRCEKGHEWEAAVKSRTINKTGCPYCSHNKVLAGFNDLATLLPDIAAEWSDRNYPLLPTQVTVFANRKAWWKCKDCRREWNTLISTRSGGSKCPYCSGYIFLKGFNDLQTTHPEIASEWSEKNLSLKPDEVNAKSRKNVWWKCRKCGNEWKSVINARVKGTVCPVCAEREVLAGYNDLATTDSQLLSEWDYEQNKLKPTQVSRTSAKRAWWKCRHGHSWSMKINERTILNKGCRFCEQEYLSLFPALAVSYYSNKKGLKAELGSAGFGTPEQTTLPAEMVTTIEDCGFFESIPLWAVTLIGGLFITVLSFILIMTVYGRFFKLYMYTALAPIPLSTFAGEPTQNVGKSFIKSYCAVLLEGAVIVLACIIFSVFASSPPVVNPDAAAVTQVWAYIGELVFNMLVLVGAVKMSDRIIREMMGL